MKKNCNYLIISLVLQVIFLKSVYSQYDPIDLTTVCQNQVICYEAPECSGSPFIYNCWKEVTGGTFNTSSFCPTNGYAGVRWGTTGAGWLHFWKTSFFGLMTFNHVYIDVDILRCLVECFENLTLPDAIIPTYSNALYEVDDYIIAQNNFKVLSGYVIDFTAGNNITLNAGFEAVYNSSFSATITECSLIPSTIEPEPPPGFTPENTDTMPTIHCPIDTLFINEDFVDSGYTNFYWDFGNGNTSTSNHPYVFYSEPGTYTITLAVSDSLNDTLWYHSDIMVEDCESPRIGNYLNDNEFFVDIRPNPTIGIFELTVYDINDKEVYVYDFLGKEVIKKITLEQSKNSTKIDLSLFPAGIYFVKVRSGDSIIVKKIIRL